MMEDEIQICVVLRNFKSDSDYLSLGDFWIQKLTEKDKEDFMRNLSLFSNYPGDNYLLGYWYHLKRGETPGEALYRQSRIVLFPLYRALKLFKTGNLIMPFCFTFWNAMNKWYEMQLQGEVYGLGFEFESNPYVFEKSDVLNFRNFEKEAKKRLESVDFSCSPIIKVPEKFKELSRTQYIDLATELFLKIPLIFSHYWLLIAKLLDYTIAFETLYLKKDKDKKYKLAQRASFLLSSNPNEKDNIYRLLTKFYDIRNDIVHEGQTDREKFKYLTTHIFKYEDLLRKSILAHLDLILQYPSKEEIINHLENENQSVKDSLKLIHLAK